MKSATLLAFLVVTTAVAQDEVFVTNSAELKTAIEAAEPGATIIMADGVWESEEILFEAEGLPGDTITLRAQTPGHVRLTGMSSLRIAGSYLKVEGLLFTDGFIFGGHVVQFRKDSRTPAHHSRLTNTAIVNYNPPNKATEYKWISLYGTHNRVDHSHLEGKTHDGATLVVWLDDEPNYHRIDRNYFGPRPDLGKNGGETIRIGTSDWSLYPSHTLVEQNLFDRCDGEIEIISNKSGDNIYRYNTFLESAGTLTLRHGDRARVESNFFIGNNKSHTGGVRVIGEDHVVVNNYFEGLRGTGFRSPISIVNGVPNSPLNRYFQVKRAVVAHNTIVNSYSAFEIGSGVSGELSLPPEDVVIANNIVSNEATPRINSVIVRDEPVDPIWSSNIMYGPAVGLSDVDGITSIDPMMEPGDDGRYRPASTSPAVDAADLDHSPVEDDVEGRPRPDEARTIGAHEVGEGNAEREPLVAADVGVSFAVTSSAEMPDVGGPGNGLRIDLYPNPVSTQATVSIAFPSPGPHRIEVHDVLGRRVAFLTNGTSASGTIEHMLDVARFAAGVYYLVLTTDGARVARSFQVTR